jgi:hypothetical protein
MAHLKVRPFKTRLERGTQMVYFRRIEGAGW